MKIKYDRIGRLSGIYNSTHIFLKLFLLPFICMGILFISVYYKNPDEYYPFIYIGIIITFLTTGVFLFRWGVNFYPDLNYLEKYYGTFLFFYKRTRIRFSDILYFEGIRKQRRYTNEDALNLYIYQVSAVTDKKIIKIKSFYDEKEYRIIENGIRDLKISTLKNWEAEEVDNIIIPKSNGKNAFYGDKISKDSGSVEKPDNMKTIIRTGPDFLTVEIPAIPSDLKFAIPAILIGGIVFLYFSDILPFFDLAFSEEIPWLLRGFLFLTMGIVGLSILFYIFHIKIKEVIRISNDQITFEIRYLLWPIKRLIFPRADFEALKVGDGKQEKIKGDNFLTRIFNRLIPGPDNYLIIAATSKGEFYFGEEVPYEEKKYIVNFINEMTENGGLIGK